MGLMILLVVLLLLFGGGGFYCGLPYHYYGRGPRARAADHCYSPVVQGKGVISAQTACAIHSVKIALPGTIRQ